MKIIHLALFAASAACASAQVVNPGFETGDFTGWTTTGDAQVYTAQQYPLSGIEPYSGTYYAALHAGSSIWQGGINLAVGQTVTLEMSALLTSNNSSYLLLKKGVDPTITVAWLPTFSVPFFPDKYSAISYTITEAGVYSIGAENLGPFEPTELGGGVLGVDALTIGLPRAVPVPEPSTYGLVAAALLAGLATVHRRMRALSTMSKA